LNKRLSSYFCIDKFKKIRIKERNKINKTILKDGISNFSLDILEYCNPNIVIKREQYYIDILKPEYNICKIAGSTIGHKPSEEVRIKRSIRFKGSNNPMFGKTHTKETKLLFSIIRKGSNNPMFGKVHTEETKLKIKTSILKTIAINGFKPPMQNKLHSDEVRKKMSIAKKLY
jgi:group I intron endonuclease